MDELSPVNRDLLGRTSLVSNRMQTGLRSVALGAATCRVRQCQALPAHMRADTREVSDVQTAADQRGRGYATTLLHRVCREADRAQVLLVLFPKPFDDAPMSRDELVRWYSRSFGFALLQEEPELLLARMPGSTPRLLELTPAARAANVMAEGSG